METNKLKNILGLQGGMRTHFSHAPAEYFLELGVWAAPNRGADEDGVYEFIHAFFTDSEQLISSSHILASKLSDDGMLWISWPSQNSNAKTDITEDEVRNVFTAIGLLDDKTCDVLEDWTGIRFVWAQ